MMRLRHHHSLRPINELFSTHGKMGKVDKRTGATPTLYETDDDSERTWLTEQIKENIWEMIKEMKTHKSTQNETKSKLNKL